MSTDILEGLDAPESEIGQEQPPAPEPSVDTAPPEDKAPRDRDESGKFKGKEGEPKPNSVTDKPNSVKEPPKEGGEPKTIPLAAHLEERKAHKAEIERTNAALRALQEQIEALKNPPKPPPAEPDFTADPKAYVDNKLGAALKQLETGTAEAKKTSEQAQQEAAYTRFQHALTTTEQQFAAQNPDYYDSLKHLRELRFQELSILNPDADPQQVIDAIKREEVQLAWQHMNAGRNPHDVAYRLAKTRGYQSPQAKSNGSDISALPQVPGMKQLPPDQTLGSGSGTPNAGEQFLDDDEVFDKAFNEMFGRRKSA